MSGGGRHCGSCGAACEPGALYCADCGSPLGRPPQKSLRARLPWILSALALVAFAVAISVMIRGSTGERLEGMPPTGGIIEGTPAASGGPVDLANMSPREAADRLFDRTMRTDSAGDTTQAQFFADMAVQTYGMIPAGELDADAWFHLGLLELLRGAPDAAEVHVEAILAQSPDHLLAWILSERIADMRGDMSAAELARSRFLEVYDSQQGLNLEEYVQHRGIIDDQLARLAAEG